MWRDIGVQQGVASVCSGVQRGVAIAVVNIGYGGL
jgi:hypothetical protein